jgi:hypothetical protein
MKNITILAEKKEQAIQNLGRRFLVRFFIVFGWHWMATYPSIHAVGKGGCWTLAAMRGAGQRSDPQITQINADLKNEG